MTEQQQLDLWVKARHHIVMSQIAPTILLVLTVLLFTLGLQQAPAPVRWATLGILLASGILGALVQYWAATEAIAVSKDLAARTEADAQNTDAESEDGPTGGHVLAHVRTFAPLLNVVRFLTPAIFIAIFVFLLISLI